VKNSVLKSILTVLAGFATVAILSTAMDAILESAGILPPNTKPELLVTWMLVLAFTYRSVFTVLGGYVTAKLAPENKQNHVKALMVLGGIGGILGVIFGWNLSDHWYPILLAITGPLFIWLGGKLFLNKSGGYKSTMSKVV
jgi:predicted MFS family arabinose efflux permease